MIFITPYFFSFFIHILLLCKYQIYTYERKVVTMNDKKYEILKEDSMKYKGRKVYRIRALKDFSDVKKGQLGGYVEREYNLSQKGNCWVGDSAIVCEDGLVQDYAKILDHSIVDGDAFVCANAIICNNAQLHDNVQVGGNAKIGGHALIQGKAEIYGNTYISDQVVISGTAMICGNATVSKCAKIRGNVLIKGNVVVTGNACISDQASVLDASIIRGNAIVSDCAKIGGNAIIERDARVSDNAVVAGNAHVSGNMVISGNKHIIGKEETLNIFIIHNMSDLSPIEVMEIRKSAIKDIENNHEELSTKYNLNIISNYEHIDAPSNAGRLWHLGKSIQQLGEADYIYFVKGHSNSDECLIERMIAKLYGIKELD